MAGRHRGGSAHHSALEETGVLFTRLTQAGKDAGLNTAAATKQSLALTETINQAIQLSGASAQASSAAITQLVQGLQGGALRGDEFNSVMEQSPRLARALADGLGVTTGELRKMAEAGLLTSDTVIKALQGQSQTVATEFSKLPPTVGRALQDLSTQWTLYVGETDKATGASAAAATAINAVSSNLRTIAGLLIDAGRRRQRSSRCAWRSTSWASGQRRRQLHPPWRPATRKWWQRALPARRPLPAWAVLPPSWRPCALSRWWASSPTSGTSGRGSGRALPSWRATRTARRNWHAPRSCRRTLPRRRRLIARAWQQRSRWPSIANSTFQRPRAPL
ncbi:tape measure protein [Paracidovorax citrulli]|uniref:tape measure protein n=1 Tax=Paracidovorax citrulli TaxID=80869 RepID=UPI000BC36416|nr:tape measure protein [Paracidovorax citrulli]ATG92631.1 hypothetical protein CQB05_00025 [Paracidovorax citrulli]